MLKYYFMLVSATFLYSFQFIFTKLYQREKGSSFYYSMIFGAIACFATLPFALFLTDGKIEFTPFSFTIAFLYALDVTVYMVFGTKTLSRANLSLYSLFSMIGGMLLPFLYGLIFIGESITIAKAIALVSVCIAMILPLKKEKGKRTDKFTFICFAVIFITNGLTGVLTYVHQRSQLNVVSAGGFLFLYNSCRSVFSLIIITLLYIYGKKDERILQVIGASENQPKKSKIKSRIIAVGAAIGYAIMNGTAVLLTTLTAKEIAAGVQSTIITGGVIALTALSGLFFNEKLTRQMVFSIVFALIGTILITF